MQGAAQHTWRCRALSGDGLQLILLMRIEAIRLTRIHLYLEARFCTDRIQHLQVSKVMVFGDAASRRDAAAVVFCWGTAPLARANSEKYLGVHMHVRNLHMGQTAGRGRDKGTGGTAHLVEA